MSANFLRNLMLLCLGWIRSPHTWFCLYSWESLKSALWEGGDGATDTGPGLVHNNNTGERDIQTLHYTSFLHRIIQAQRSFLPILFHLSSFLFEFLVWHWIRRRKIKFRPSLSYTVSHHSGFWSQKCQLWTMIVCVGLCDQISFSFIWCKKGWVLLHLGECSNCSDCSVVEFYGAEYLTEWNDGALMTAVTRWGETE